MKDLWQKEPAIVTAIGGAIVSVAAAFGLNISTTTEGAIVAAVVTVLGFVTRSQVSPAAKP